MILDVSGSSGLVRGAAAVVLILHISAGSVGLLSGAAALLFRKGSRWHRTAGNVFFVSMLTMSAIAACVAPFLPRWDNAVMGVFTFYLVATGWVTVRHKENSVGLFEIGAFLVASGAAAASLMFGLEAAKSQTGIIEGLSYRSAYGFATLWALAAVLDLSVILRGGVSGAQRIARHLWRMCVGLLIAAVSFFLGQQQVFPASVRGSPFLLVPEIAIVGLMIFWLLRVRFTNRFKHIAAAN